MDATRTFSPLDWQLWLREAGVVAKLRKRPCARAVLHMIATYADQHGNARPAAERLAEDTGYCLRSVRRALAELVELKILDMVRGGGRHRTTVYRMARGGAMPLFAGLDSAVVSHPNNGAETVTPASLFRGGNGDTGVTVSGGETVTPRHPFKSETVTQPSRNSDTGVTPSGLELVNTAAAAPDSAPETAGPPSAPNPNSAAAIALLTKAGLKPGRAEELAGLAGWDLARLEALLAWVDLQQRRRKPIANPSRWLYAAITTPFEIPDEVQTELRERARKVSAKAAREQAIAAAGAQARAWFAAMPVERVVELRASAIAIVIRQRLDGRQAAEWLEGRDLCCDGPAALMAVRALRAPTTNGNAALTKDERRSLAEAGGLEW